MSQSTKLIKILKVDSKLKNSVYFSFDLIHTKKTIPIQHTNRCSGSQPLGQGRKELKSKVDVIASKVSCKTVIKSTNWLHLLSPR